MRIFKTLSAFKEYTRRPRVAPGRVASQASCMVLNTVKAYSEREARRVDAIVREAVWSAYGRGLKESKA